MTVIIITMGRRQMERNKKPCRIKCNVDNSVFREVQCVIREQLAFYTSPMNLEGLSEEKRLLKDLIIRTVKYGESNSVLLVGHRGGGKTALINTVKDELCILPDFSNNCVIVDLNGLVHTDDRITLKSIIHQLQVENSFDGRGSFADTLTFVLEALKSGSHSSKSVLFILDEFDLFCHNKNQTLLYNLFDVAQSLQVPVAIVGLTNRLDVMELLEKRVKSRFSHRIIYLFVQLSFENYMNIAKALLCLPKQFSVNASFKEEWNKHVKELLEEKAVRDIFKRLYDTSRDIRALKKFLLLPVSAVNENHTNIEPNDFTNSQKLQTLDSQSDMLLDLSVLEFCLILTIVHLNSIHDGEPLNFEIIYHEFEQNIQKKASLQQFNKTVTMKAFEHLLSLELVKVVGGNTANIQKNYQMVELQLVPSQVQEALQAYHNLPTDLEHWAASAFS